MRFHSKCAGLIRVTFVDMYNAFYLYINDELFDTAHSADELQTVVENHNTGCFAWDYCDERPAWVTSD